MCIVKDAIDATANTQALFISRNNVTDLKSANFECIVPNKYAFLYNVRSCRRIYEVNKSICIGVVLCCYSCKLGLTHVADVCDLTVADVCSQQAVKSLNNVDSMELAVVSTRKITRIPF